MATLIVVIIIFGLVGLDIWYLWKNKVKKGQLGCCDCTGDSSKGGCSSGCGGCSGKCS